jgi:RIO kinase 1
LGQNRDNEQMEALQAFIDQGVIESVLGVVKSGKEATVYVCETEAGDLVAAKVYRSRKVRQFANAAAYSEGRTRGMLRRDALAIAKKSRFGQELAFGKWVADEYETLRVLHRAGVAVPRPMLMSESIILMEYLGDDEPAVPLANARIDAAESRRVFDLLMRNIELMLANDRVHGDLSAYNVLYYEGDVRIIDFPQAVDPRFNTGALELLERDLENLCGYFERQGVRADSHRIARSLWGRFLRSEL